MVIAGFGRSDENAVVLEIGLLAVSEDKGRIREAFPSRCSISHEVMNDVFINVGLQMLRIPGDILHDHKDWFVGGRSFRRHAPCCLGRGNLAKRATRLVPLQLDAAQGFSQTNYELKTGTYYRWRIISDGREEYKLLAPELFRNSWINQISINDKEVKPAGLYAVEFDSDGKMDIWFVPIRAGKYRFYVEGLESQGFEGAVLVR